MPVPKNAAPLQEIDRDAAKAAALVALSDPMRETLRQIAEECELSPKVVDLLSQRLGRDFLPLKRALESITSGEMSKLYRYQAWRVLSSISDEDIEKAGLKEKAISAAVLTDKSLLLDGQPTQIYSVKELENLNVLGGMLLEEMRRRGLEPTPNEATQQVSSTDHGLLGTSKDPSTQGYAWEDEPR